jgi:hypothetical protein
MGSDVGETVRRAIEQAHEQAARAAEAVPQILAQIDFDDVLADTAALAYIGNDLSGSRVVVKNAPYGRGGHRVDPGAGRRQRIVRKSTALLARDRLGRTRRRRRGERGAIIYVSDPIEGRATH